ncbi:MAG: N-acetylmuramoyl-L-alanine amidase [Deltaproteobacteria bacterium]|nr:N-acetylmuramoyl-L-alanine amidase [Candidatus Tharpella sp.]
MFTYRSTLKRLLIVSLLILMSGMIFAGTLYGAGAQLPAEKSFKAAKKSYNQFMAKSRDWGQRRRWVALIKDFDSLARNYPHSKRADDALYLSAGLYSSLYNYSGLSLDLQQAAKRYKMLLKSYGQSRLADDALYNLGVIALKLKDKKKAREQWQTLLRDYPASDMRERAQSSIDDLNLVKRSRVVKQNRIPRKKTKVSKAKYRHSGSSKPLVKSVKARKNARKGLSRVLDLRHWSSPTYTRVVIDLDRETDFTKGILKDRHNSKKTKSIYLNLADSVVPKVSREIVINDGILQRVKVSQFNAHTVRAVIHVADIDHYKILALSHPPRIVIDVIGGDYKKSRRKRTQKNSPRKSSNNGTLSLAQQLGLGVGTIVLDAGHGGKDPGALSAKGSREKDVVLDISKRLKEILQKRLKCRVVTTRNSDKFIPLEARTVVANTKKADLFVSIHANASRNRRAHGVETYFLNLSTDKEAMELAALENATSTKNIGQLQSILNDLMQNSKIKESSRLASCVQNSLVGKLRQSYRKVNNLGVKQAPFYVLIGAQMPSILVEVSFISNKMEAQRLATGAYRQKIAEGLADGIEKYIREIKLARL